MALLKAMLVVVHRVEYCLKDMLYVPCLQAHLEIAPDSQNLTSEGFDELKVSNALRYEVLTEILTSLGLSCERNQTPAPSPVHLLATSQVRPTLLICRYQS